MIDKDKLFGLFSNEEKLAEAKVNLKRLKDDPYTKIGMFNKLIQNHNIFHQKLEKFLSQENPNFDIDITKRASEYTVFNRAFNYISKLNPLNSEIRAIFKTFDPIILQKSITIVMNYFIETEEYEKCAHLRKFEEILEEK
tara:strand:+ start:288 stop:707 length:420 start_codon:yes stop_codon:yes gene_type:complete